MYVFYINSYEFYICNELILFGVCVGISFGFLFKGLKDGICSGSIFFVYLVDSCLCI